MANFQVLAHHPIGISDASIAVLDSHAAEGKVRVKGSGAMQRLNMLGHKPALIVIDMQIGFDDAAWGARNNPKAEAHVAALLAACRAAAAPVVHVHHDSPSPRGLLRSGTPGHAPKPEAKPLANEKIYRKRVNSAFIGTTLEADLRALRVDSLLVVGLTTNHCVSTTARMAGNLGFETFVVADATAAFARTGLDGAIRPPEEVHLAALSDIEGEFARVVDTKSVLEALACARAPIPRRCAGGRAQGLY